MDVSLEDYILRGSSQSVCAQQTKEHLLRTTFETHRKSVMRVNICLVHANTRGVIIICLKKLFFKGIFLCTADMN